MCFLLHVGVKQPNVKSGLSSDKSHYELKIELDQVYPLFHIVNIYYEISITAYDMY